MVVIGPGGARLAGVPVAVVGHGPRGMTVHARATTGADGVANLSLAGNLRALVEPVLHVSLALPLDEPVEAEFAPAHLPERPIELAMPPTVAVVVNLVRADGSPFTDPAAVRLDPMNLARERGAEGLPRLVAEARDGSATFPFVGLGRPLSVKVRPADRTLRAVEHAVAAPRAPDRDTVVTVTCGAPAAVVSGRLVDSESRPLVHTTFAAWLPEPPGAVCSPPREEPESRATDGEGHFTAAFDVDPVTLSVKHVLIAAEEAEAETGARILGQNIRAPLRAGPRPGTFDAGAVVVPLLPRVASGVVVDQDGAPVPDARLALLRRRGSEWKKEDEYYGVKARADADGRFEVRGVVAGEGLALIATAQRRICVDPTPFEIGQRDLKVTLAPAGGIGVKIAGLEDGLWEPEGTGPVRVLIAGPGAAIAARNTDWRFDRGDRLETWFAEGWFLTGALLPGAYSVQILPRGAPYPVVTVENVVVKAGESTKDLRLWSIGASDFMKKRTVTVIDHETGRGVDAIVGARAPGGDTPFARFRTGPSGAAKVVTAAPMADLVVVAEGYEAVERPEVTGDVTIRLRPALPRLVTIRLAASAALPPPPFSISAELVWMRQLGPGTVRAPDPDDPRNVACEEAVIGCDRTAMLRVQNRGVYVVHLWVRDARHPGAQREWLGQHNWDATVHVGDGAAADVTVAPDPEQLANLVRMAIGK